MKSSIIRILNISDRTYYNWKSEGRPIIGLLEKYFTSDDLEEYLQTGSISRLENLDNLDSDLLERHIAYELKHKLYLDTQSSFFKWFEHIAGTGVMDMHVVYEELYNHFD